jgi:DNA-binding NarL/FixJ family response regulator
MTIRVFIYDDSHERIDSLKSLLLLDDQLEVVGEGENCSNVIKDMEKCRPDIVLMDINMPVSNGLDGLRAIKSNYPEIKVLMQTAFDDSDKIFESIRNGASGYILKSDKPLKILESIQEVMRGGASMNPAIAQKVLDFFLPKKFDNPLSPKETEVLALLSEGLSYKMVADRLGISYSTVNTHTKRIYEKLHISSLGEAIAFYYKNIQ